MLGYRQLSQYSKIKSINRFWTIIRCLQYDCFADRHIGPSDAEKKSMLKYLGYKVCYVLDVTKTNSSFLLILE